MSTDLNDTYRCICGHVCKGWDVIAHYKEKHPVLYHEIVEKYE